jgi:hypothetical protein
MQRNPVTGLPYPPGMAPPPAHVLIQQRLNTTRKQHAEILLEAHSSESRKLAAAMQKKEKLYEDAEKLDARLKNPPAGATLEVLNKEISDLEKKFAAVDNEIKAAAAATQAAWENYLRVDAEKKGAEASSNWEQRKFKWYKGEGPDPGAPPGRRGGGRRTRRKGRKAH